MILGGSSAIGKSSYCLPVIQARGTQEHESHEFSACGKFSISEVGIAIGSSTSQCRSALQTMARTLEISCYGRPSLLPSYWLNLINPKSPREATGSQQNGSNHKWHYELSSPINQKSGQSRCDYTRKICKSVLQSCPFPVACGPARLCAKVRGPARAAPDARPSGTSHNRYHRELASTQPTGAIPAIVCPVTISALRTRVGV